MRTERDFQSLVLLSSDPARQDLPPERPVPKKQLEQGYAYERRNTACSKAYIHLPQSPSSIEQLTLGFVDIPKKVECIEARPFIKWVGGKSSSLMQLEKFIPPKIDRYFEPFLGGGAMFFYLKHRFPGMRAFLSDSNKELINCYCIVRDHPEELMQQLDFHAKQFYQHGKEYYYEIRKHLPITDALARAARTILLNKTCFNGLWRVNSRGEFNTPVGSNRRPSLYNRENLLACSLALHGAQLEVGDFRKVLENARQDDFIYFDPPYLPISAYSDFNRYTADQFREADQAELARIFNEMDARGCRLILSNSEHTLIRTLYAGHKIDVISVPRAINCKAKGRGNISELLISNTTSSKESNLLNKKTPAPEFPETKFMGSKQRLLPFILRTIKSLNFTSILDAFSGSGCVAYAMKQTGARVYANDFLHFCYHTAHATIENNTTLLSEDDINRLIRPASTAPTFIRDTYKELFFNEIDSEFLDHLWTNIQTLESPLKVSIALAAASRACMKKRPRGIFTTTGQKGWDDRLDLKLSLRDQFLLAVAAFNNAVFSNGKENKAFNLDVFSLPPDIADVVYIDPPYISPYSDCDYTRRYHFVEGFCRYWQGCEIMYRTKTKKIQSYETAFASKAGAFDAFQRLFHHFHNSKLVVSYSSNCIPSKSEMVDLLKAEKKKVTVFETTHHYHHGNQAHKVGDNNNKVAEYLFVAE